LLPWLFMTTKAKLLLKKMLPLQKGQMLISINDDIVSMSPKWFNRQLLITNSLKIPLPKAFLASTIMSKPSFCIK